MQNIPIVGKFLVAIGVAIYSSNQLKSIDRRYHDLMEHQERAASLISRGGRNLQTARAAVAELMIAKSHADDQRATAELAAAAQHFAQFMDRAALASPPDADEIQALKTKGLSVINTACRDTIRLGNLAQTDAQLLASQTDFLRDCAPYFPPITTAMRTKVETLSKAAEQMSDRLRAASDHAVFLTLSVILGSLGLAVAMASFAVRRWITRPLEELAEAMRRLAEGDLALAVPGKARGDEIGVMARTVQVFKDASIQKALLEREAEERASAFERLALEAQYANRAKSEFLATMSHEIRTPLNGVLGMVQIMERGALEPAQRERLDVVQSSANALLGVVNDVLDISRIEAGRLEIAPSIFCLDHFANGLRRLYDGLVQEKGLTFTLEASNPPLGWRYGDEVRLRQIMSNLISNALKFTETGEVRVGVAAAPDQITLTVADTGPGIAPDHQARIFDKFTQLDSSNTRRAGGTGLGLAICKELVVLMGGDITLRSELGVGSIFTVTLPLAAAEPPIDETPAQDLNEDGAQRILVVDDNATNRMVLTTLLEQFGIGCEAVTNGFEAVRAWESGEWSAILMDINMPVMDGLEATRAIRAQEVSQSRPRTAIIAVTASVMSHETEIYKSAGMDDVVPKPVNARQLYDALSRQLAGEDGVEA
jgi:signal transduction histidine kinase/ActR/RegA family two-component response regulator